MLNSRIIGQTIMGSQEGSHCSNGVGGLALLFYTTRELTSKTTSDLSRLYIDVLGSVRNPFWELDQEYDHSWGPQSSCTC